MCWFNLPKIDGLAGKLRATDMQRTAAQEAQKPDAPVFGLSLIHISEPTRRPG